MPPRVLVSACATLTHTRSLIGVICKPQSTRQQAARRFSAAQAAQKTATLRWLGQETWRAPQKEPPSPALRLERALKQRHRRTRVAALAFVNSAGTSRAAARHEKRRVRRVVCSTGVGGELNIMPGQGGGLSRMRYFLTYLVVRATRA